MIVDGQLEAGRRLSEVRLAETLGVSRTPLREALIRLAAEHFVIARPRIGFSVPPLTVMEAEQVFAVRAILEPEAIRATGTPTFEALKSLEQLNQQIRNSIEPAERLALDHSWHQLFVVQCPNRILTGLAEQFMVRTRRYETALLRDAGNLRVSTTDHDRIIEALRKGDVLGACEILSYNIKGASEPIIAWLKSRQSGL